MENAQNNILTCKNHTSLSGSQLTKISVPFFHGILLLFLKDNLGLLLSVHECSAIKWKHKVKLYLRSGTFQKVNNNVKHTKDTDLKQGFKTPKIFMKEICKYFPKIKYSRKRNISQFYFNTASMDIGFLLTPNGFVNDRRFQCEQHFQIRIAWRFFHKSNVN